MSDDPLGLLIVWHSRTGASEQLARSAALGAGDGAKLVRARDVELDHLLNAKGYLFVCPENLASMTGEMKEMLDTHYYGALGQIEGRPYASIIAAGSDGEGAQRQLERILTGWRLKRVMEPRIVNFDAQTPEEIWAPKTASPQMLSLSEEIGTALAEGIRLGVF